jgi:hypothetical protein
VDAIRDSARTLDGMPLDSAVESAREVAAGAAETSADSPVSPGTQEDAKPGTDLAVSDAPQDSTGSVTGRLDARLDVSVADSHPQEISPGDTRLSDSSGSDSGAQDSAGQDSSVEANGPSPDSPARDMSPADSPPSTNAWQSRGVGGGGAFFVPEISPVDDQIYMATDMGSVFSSADFGAKWSPLDFRQLAGGSASQIRFTSNPKILYAIAPINEVQVPFISKDGGATFAQLTDPTATELYYIEVDPNRSDRLFVSTYDSLLFSSDSGATFHQAYTAADSGAGLVLAGAFWDGTNIYVGTNDGVLLSTNNGTSFALQSFGGMTAGQAIVSFAAAKQGAVTRFFAVTSSSSYPGQAGCETEGEGLFRLDVGQSTWTNLTSALPSGHTPVYVGMATNNTSVAFVAGRDMDAATPTVAKTTDSGATWTSVFRTTGNENIATGWSGEGGDKDWSYGECPEGFAVSRGNANKVAITDMGFVHVTSDGGTSWRQAYVNPADQNPAGADTPKGREYRGVGAENTSVWWLTWTDPKSIFASFTDITSLRSTDNGLHWMRESENGLTLNTTYQTLLAPSGTLYAATSPVHDMYMSYRLQDTYLDKTSGAVMQSTDKGGHWTLLHNFNHPVVFLALDPKQADTMYASVVHHTAGGIFRTTNLSQGASSTWTQLPNPPRTEGHPYNIVVLNDGSVVATYSGRRATAFTDSAGVFLLPPGGSAWNDVSDVGMHYWVKDLVIDHNDASQNTWYVGVFQAWGLSAAEDTGGLYRTTSRGQSWQRIWPDHNVESVTIDPGNPAKMFVTTEADGLWVTTNSNAPTPTFTVDPDYPFSHPMRVFFNPSVPGEAWVASFGGGLRVRQF